MVGVTQAIAGSQPLRHAEQRRQELVERAIEIRAGRNTILLLGGSIRLKVPVSPRWRGFLLEKLPGGCYRRQIKEGSDQNNNPDGGDEKHHFLRAVNMLQPDWAGL